MERIGRGRGRGVSRGGVARPASSGEARQASGGEPSFNSDDRAAANRSHRRGRGGGRDDRKARSTRCVVLPLLSIQVEIPTVTCCWLQGS